MHNGAISDFRKVKRDLAFAVDPSLYPDIEESTDSELFFVLALTFGLETDPLRAVQRAVGFIEKTGRAHGVRRPIRMTVATSDGDAVWVFRYSSGGETGSLFYSAQIGALRALYPENEVFQSLSEESRVVVSEPLSGLPGVWKEVPKATWGVVRRGADDLAPFRPRPS